MNTKPYHHGDLRNLMIEKGIDYINEHGAKSLSLRKIAAACEVSHAAPYSHFASKEELLSGIEKYITDKFARVLKESVKEVGETPEGLYCMGSAYIRFFARNPEYFRFIFSRSSIAVGVGHEYEPYDYYIQFMEKMLSNMDYPRQLWKKTAYAHWAMIHGLASIAVMSKPEDISYWEEMMLDILADSVTVQASPFSYQIVKKES